MDEEHGKPPDRRPDAQQRLPRLGTSQSTWFSARLPTAAGLLYRAAGLAASGRGIARWGGMVGPGVRCISGAKASGLTSDGG